MIYSETGTSSFCETSLCTEASAFCSAAGFSSAEVSGSALWKPEKGNVALSKPTPTSLCLFGLSARDLGLWALDFYVLLS